MVPNGMLCYSAQISRHNFLSVQIFKLVGNLLYNRPIPKLFRENIYVITKRRLSKTEELFYIVDRM